MKHCHAKHMAVKVHELYPPYPFISTPNHFTVLIEWFGCLEELSRKGIESKMEVLLRKYGTEDWRQVYMWVESVRSLIFNLQWCRTRLYLWGPRGKHLLWSLPALTSSKTRSERGSNQIYNSLRAWESISPTPTYRGKCNRETTHHAFPQVRNLDIFGPFNISDLVNRWSTRESKIDLPRWRLDIYLGLF